MENNILFANATLDIELQVDFNVHFYVEDFVDKEKFHLGSRRYKKTVHKDVEALSSQLI